MMSHLLRGRSWSPPGLSDWKVQAFSATLHCFHLSDDHSTLSVPPKDQVLNIIQLLSWAPRIQ